jgi:hypothetical protein
LILYYKKESKGSEKGGRFREFKAPMSKLQCSKNKIAFGLQNQEGLRFNEMMELIGL